MTAEEKKKLEWAYKNATQEQRRLELKLERLRQEGEQTVNELAQARQAREDLRARLDAEFTEEPTP